MHWIDEEGDCNGTRLPSPAAVILSCNEPENPRQLWEDFVPHFVEDIVDRAREAGLPLSEDEAENAALWEVELFLRHENSGLSKWPSMPQPYEPRAAPKMSEYRRMETAYDPAEQGDKVREMEEMLNEEQRAAYEAICAALVRPVGEAKCFFVYACGGSGKTFLLKLLLSHVRAQRQIAVHATAYVHECLCCGRLFL